MSDNTNVTITKPVFQKLSSNHLIQIHDLEHVNCNLCGAQHLPEDCMFVEESTFSVIKCRKCGLVYVSPQPSFETLHHYYEDFFVTADSPDSSAWLHKHSFKQVQKLLQNIFPETKGATILEVGSGYGHFLTILERYTDFKVTGIEPDQSLAEQLKTSFPNTRIINTTVELAMAELQAQEFDVIALIASLEHFKNPSFVLEECKRRLKPGGKIIIRVPFAEGYFNINRLLKKRIMPFGAPRHLYDFSDKTLGAMLAENGFQDIVIEPGARESTEGLIYTIIVNIIKSLCKVLWLISGKRYISSFTGSVVAVATKSK